MHKYYYDETGERASGWESQGFLKHPPLFSELKSGSVVVIHWRDYAGYISQEGIDRELDDKARYNDIQSVVFIFVSGALKDIDKAEDLARARETREKILSDVFPDSKIFYYKLGHGAESPDELKGYINYLSKYYTENENFDSVQGPREYTAVQFSNKCPQDVFEILLNTFLIIRNRNAEELSSLEGMIKKDFPFTWKMYWEPFRILLKGKSLDETFENPSSLLTCAEKVNKIDVGSNDNKFEILLESDCIKEYWDSLLLRYKEGNK